MTYSLNIKNNTHYISDHYRTHNKIINPKVFANQRSRQLSYNIRCYYHHLSTLQNGGMTLYYTLTYNNKALPHFMGVPTIDYNDLRYLMSSSGLNKNILRNYGYRMQYIITCELGDGKGKRGIANNPHYHILFFLNKDFDYIKKYNISNILTPILFKRIIQKYWCGDLRQHCTNYKFGICVPGDNYGLVDSPKAINYVTKYVLKDNTYWQHYYRLKNATLDYIKNRLYKMRLFRHIYYDRRSSIHSYNNDPFVIDFAERIYNNVYKKHIRNNYLPKVRISHGVGISALKHVNSDGLTINMPTKSTIKAYRLPLYIYRKLYFTVVKDGANNNKYILNDLGIKIQIKNFDCNLRTKFNRYKSILNLYNNFTDDDIYRYTLYDYVYRDRLIDSFTINPKTDYSDFIVPDYYTCPYLDDVASWALSYRLYKTRATYIYHPYFDTVKKNLKLFDKLINDYYICQSNEQERIYKFNKQVKSNISQSKINKLYG